MSKHFRIKFSAADAMIALTDEMGKPVNKPTRGIEKLMLSFLFNAAGASAKTFSEQRVAADNIANVDAVGLDTPDASILLTEEDYKQLVKGQELTVGQRPFVWNRLSEMIAQLEKPTEEKVQ